MYKCYVMLKLSKYNTKNLVVLFTFSRSVKLATGRSCLYIYSYIYVLVESLQEIPHFSLLTIIIDWSSKTFDSPRRKSGSISPLIVLVREQ